MGFERVFKNVPIKLDDRFNPVFKDRDTLESNVIEQKNNIILYCMQDHSDDGNKGIIKSITSYVKLYINAIEELVKLDLCERVEEEKGYIWFRGYEWEHRNDDTEYDKKTYYNRNIQNLSLLAAVVKTPDYWDEHEFFYEKVERIEDELDIENEVYENIIHEFIRFYKDYDVTYEDEEESSAKE